MMTKQDNVSRQPPFADSFRTKILPLRLQKEVVNQWLQERLDSILAEIMQREGFDMWLIIAQEYNEDPVMMTFLPAPALSARRRAILMFSLDQEGKLSKLALDRYGYPGFYEPAWNPDEEGQYECLTRVVRERDPAVIGINVSDTFAFGDGLTQNEYKNLAAALGNDYMTRTKGAERLCVGWLERRIAPEIVVYPGLVEIGHAIIAEAFSSRVIQPGITTTEDVVWWMRQKMADMGLKAWFQPAIELQAADVAFDTFIATGQDRNLILPGDLLHCDMGFTYIGLTTDQQQHAYILKPGETDAPAGLKAALVEGNRLQDLVMEAMIVGRTGNEVLKAAREKAMSEGIDPSIYCHPLGYHGHAAGPTIGLWDGQEGVPGKGDYELFDDTCYSIELCIFKKVPEWGNQVVRIALEEDAILTGGQMRWLDGRQTAFHLVGPA